VQSPLTFLYPPVRQFQSSEILAMQMARQLEIDTHRRRRTARGARRRLHLVAAAIVLVAAAVAINAVTA